MKRTFKLLIVGIVASSLLLSSAVWASNGTLSNVFKGTSKFIVNQVDKTPSNSTFHNGITDVPASLIYEGTTYVPIRLVSDMLDVPIEWDGANKAVLIGTSVYDGTYLTDIAPAEIDNNIWVNREVSYADQKYNNTLLFKSNRSQSYAITYNLNAQYDVYSFTYGAITGQGYFEIFDENGNVIWEGQAVKNVKPQDVTVDVSGVLSMTIKYTDTSDVTDGWAGAPVQHAVMVNPFLKGE